MRPTLMLTLTTIALLLGASGTTQAQIKSPGSHARYGVELEPHLVFQWAGHEYWNEDGIGLGVRASIPVIQDGPVRTINNNFAITFGLDWSHVDDCGPWNNDLCSSDEFWIPVAAQWNFFLTDSISLFPELGLAFQHSRVSLDGAIPGCGRNDWCDGEDTDTDIELVLWLGARFGLSDDIALTLRLGTPSLLFGVSFLL
jgi:hypothetical protein